MRQLLHPVLVLLSLLLLLVATPSAAAGHCGLEITNCHLTNSWQSSTLSGLYDIPHTVYGCFWNRSDADTRLTIGWDNYFHSEIGVGADDGYQWFVLQLKDEVVIDAVDLGPGPFHIGRPFWYTKEEWKSRCYRHKFVEVWTSPKAVDFGANHCTSHSISATFSRQAADFVLCGNSGNSQHQTEFRRVACTQRPTVRTLLFRRSVSHGRRNRHSSMSFSYIRLWTWHIDMSVNNANAILNVNRDDKLVVKCSSSCSVRKHRLRLCLPNGSCVCSPLSAAPSIRIRMAAAQHNGTFRCKLIHGGNSTITKAVVVNIFYPPDSLAISVNESVTTCELEEIPELLFTFTSSAASPPAVNHTCKFTVDGRQVNVRKSSEVAGANGEVASEWVTQVAVQNNGAFAISCDARQPPSVTGGLPSVHHVHWLRHRCC